ncbi:hypothetical protein SDRG_16966 [Saprolegnia diclina VS20]|uniref:Peptidase C1A papain C-terminal domain-containing protein n=1 Tax=Saprolegnia diclina (strain VS20) TaxID=1156394 RepID=T0QZI2_SAPDV|nr:hypothetical protein SDRG_16966 [Saprolegnia diclina VS20]EQC25158.1 hypothetical protein SDRG_16966 [Saprolegnia diclina VS20]|eukprot:XP_008621415.1 hypothetical protein SDRG_16966 [Saprolegnia diclina VS20]
MGDPHDVVRWNQHAMQRRLSTASSVPSLNWCSTNNPTGRSVCAEAKSQRQCGSCWAFAATDVIETAVSLATGNPPVSLSSQQLRTCSTSKAIRTFEYCFANAGNVPKWLEPSMKWDGHNKGCDGGMTHVALDDAAKKIVNLASASTGPHITGWEPALTAASCATTKDPATLLKTALAKGPLAVAVSTEGGFQDYSLGVYTCPPIVSSDKINHALLLVGYDTSDQGDYWILKNSYGVGWGLHGFMHLHVDDVVNCGLNVFPVRALGASRGPASTTTVDGALTFGGMAMDMWIVVASLVTAATLLLTIIGVFVSRRRMQYLRQSA